MSDKKNSNILRLCIAAMFAALICVATMVIQVPAPMGGFLNFGDCFILVGAWLLGPVYGFAAGAIGSAMADIFTGYAIFAPATFVIKGLIALVASVIAHSISAKRSSLKPLGHAVGAIAGELVMVFGYYAYEALVLGYGFTGAAAGMPMNIMQGAVGVIFGFIIMQVIVKTKIAEKL